MIADVDDLVAVPRLDVERLASRASQRWMSVEATAEYMDVSVDTVRRLIAGGKIAGHRPVPGKILCDRLQVDAYISGCTSRPRISRGRGRA